MARRNSKDGWCSWCFVLVMAALGGCKSSQETPVAPRTEEVAKPPQGLAGLPELLAKEAAARPGGTPTLEALTAALKDSVSFGVPRQVYGQKMLASYCAAADSVDGMLVTICEYPSPEQARRGETEANLLFSKLAGHQSRTSQKSVLHLIARPEAPPDHVAKVLSAFDAL